MRKEILLACATLLYLLLFGVVLIKLQHGQKQQSESRNPISTFATLPTSEQISASATAAAATFHIRAGIGLAPRISPPLVGVPITAAEQSTPHAPRAAQVLAAAAESAPLVVAAGGLTPVLRPSFCPLASAAAVTSWRELRNHLQWAPRAGANVRGDFLNIAMAGSPTWFCDKHPPNVKPWVVPRRYAPRDLHVGIFSGEQIVYSRAVTARDTWLSEGVSSDLYTSTVDRNAPTVGFEDWGLRPDWKVGGKDTLSLQLLAMMHAYEAHPEKQWYGTFGCDTHINVDHALLMLEAHDSTEKLWITLGGMQGTGPRRGQQPSWKPGNWTGPWTGRKSGSIRTADWPERLEDGYLWTSGATGWFVSNPAMKAFAAAVPKFLAQHSSMISELCYCPDRITSVIFALLGQRPTTLSKHWLRASAPSAPDSSHADTRHAEEWLLSHYLTPRRMVAQHERSTHEKLDRMVNAGMGAEISEWGAQFVTRHAAMVARRAGDVLHLCPTFPPEVLHEETAAPALNSNPPYASAGSALDDAGVAAFRADIGLHFARLRFLQAQVGALAEEATALVTQAIAR